MSSLTSYPLIWPPHVQRNPHPIAGRRRLSVATAQAEVMRTFDCLADITGGEVTDVALTSGLQSGKLVGKDGAAAVWFSWNGTMRCVPSDLYTGTSENLAAIGQLLTACIAEFERGGVAAVNHALAAFLAPSLKQPSPIAGWSEILDVGSTASETEIRTAFRKRALEKHPDHGGSRGEWDELVAAYEQARQATACAAWSVPTNDLDGSRRGADLITEDDNWADFLRNAFRDPRSDR